MYMFQIDVVDVLRILFPRLKPSGAIAIYHPDLQVNFLYFEQVDNFSGFQK